MRIKVTFVGSHLFEPTHYSLIGLFSELSKRIEIIVYAKHPFAHQESGIPAPHKFIFSDNDKWSPESDIVHLIGGGETAMRVARILDPKVPLIVSFVGGSDLSRQLKQKDFQPGYQNLFRRSKLITYADDSSYLELKKAGAPKDKLVNVPASLPLTTYKICQGNKGRTAIMVGRPIARKNHFRAVEVAKQSKHLRRLFLVGTNEIFMINPRVESMGIISHQKLMLLFEKTDVLLQTGDWGHGEIDSLPTVVLEALAMGIPVVSTPLPEIKKLSRHYPDFVKIGWDTLELAKNLDEALLNPRKTDRALINRSILEAFGLKKNCVFIHTLYEKLLR